MKGIITLLFCLFYLGSTAQTKQIDFAKKMHDFGDVREWKNNPAVFSFKNLSGQTIKVLPTRHSPDLKVIYPKEPILPGAMGQIEAIYYTDKPEEFNKRFPIYFSHDALPTYLEIKGKILKLHPEAFIACPTTDEKPKDFNNTYDLDVQVVDEYSNLPVKNAQVIFAIGGKEIHKYRTNSTGSFTVKIKFDTYDVFIEAVGFQNKKEEKVLNKSVTFYQIKIRPFRNSSETVIPVATQTTQPTQQVQNTQRTETRTTTAANRQPTQTTQQNNNRTTTTQENKNFGDKSGFYREKKEEPQVIVQTEVVRDTVVKREIVKRTDTVVQREIVRKTDTVVQKEVVYKRDTLVQTNTVVQKEIVQKTDTVVQVKRETIVQRDTVVQVKKETIVQKEIVQKTDTVFIGNKNAEEEAARLKKQLEEMQKQLAEAKEKMNEKKENTNTQKNNTSAVVVAESKPKPIDTPKQNNVVNKTPVTPVAAIKKDTATPKTNTAAVTAVKQETKPAATNTSIVAKKDTPVAKPVVQNTTPIKQENKTTSPSTTAATTAAVVKKDTVVTKPSNIPNTINTAVGNKQETKPIPPAAVKKDSTAKTTVATAVKQENKPTVAPVATKKDSVAKPVTSPAVSNTTNTPIKQEIKTTTNTVAVKRDSTLAKPLTANTTAVKTTATNNTTATTTATTTAAAVPIKKDTAVKEVKPVIPTSVYKINTVEGSITDLDATGTLDKNLYKPNNIVFVLDVSGSMGEGNKLKHMKQCMNKLVRVLRPTDKITIITYNLNANIVLPTSTVDDKAKINNIIDTLTPFGITNGVKGLEKAYEFMEKNFIADGNNQIIMATDGKFTKSETDDQLVCIYVKIKALNQMKLSVVGLGNDADALRRMKRLADSGKGSLIRVDNTQQAADVLLVDEIKLNSKISK